MEESKKTSSTNTLRDIESDSSDENDDNYDVDEESINMQIQLTDSLNIAMQEAPRYAINPDEFQNIQKEITIQTRFAVIDWISRVADKLQYMFAIKVFEQLGLITFENGRLEVNRGVKSKLENSELYNIIKEARK